MGPLEQHNEAWLEGYHWDEARFVEQLNQFSQLDVTDPEQQLEALMLVARMCVCGYETTDAKGQTAIVVQPKAAIKALVTMAKLKSRFPPAPPIFEVRVNLQDPPIREVL